MSSKPKVTKEETDTKSSKGPLEAVQPLFGDVISRATSALGQVNANPFTGDFVAGATAPQRSAVDQMLAIAPTLGGAAPSLADMARKVASGFFLDPANDPTFASAADAAIRPIADTLTNRILPQISDASIRNAGIGSGPAAFGGARQDIQENLALQDFDRAALDATSTLAAKSRAEGLKLIPFAPSIAEGATKEALTPAATTGQAGTLLQSFEQLQLDNALRQYQALIQGAFQGIPEALNVVTAGGFNQGTNNEVVTKTGAVPDMATQILQGLTGGAGIASSLFAAPAGGTSAAAGIGNAFSALAPLLISDRRVKNNIKKIGTFRGHNLYSYRYNWGGPLQVGFMAQEIEQVLPGAVFEISGVKVINYAKVI